jgi:hypothetical protein
VRRSSTSPDQLKEEFMESRRLGPIGLVIVALLIPSPVFAASRALAAVQELPCLGMTFQSLADGLLVNGMNPAPLGIPILEWQDEMAGALIDRVKACESQMTPMDRNAIQQSLLPRRLPQILKRADVERKKVQAREDEKQQAEARRAEELARSKEEEAAAKAEIAELRVKLADGRALSERRKAQEQEKRELTSEIQALEQQKLREETERNREAGEVQRKLQQAELESGINLRLSQASAEVRAYVGLNPEMKSPSFASRDSVGMNLMFLYTADISLRVCRERYGRFQRELEEVQRRTRLTEAVLVQVHNLPATEIAGYHEKLGIESGRSEAITQVRSNPDIVQMCQEAIRSLGLDPPLAR